MRDYSLAYILTSIGADFHREMVASAPGRITPHIWRRPMRNWIPDMNLHICSQENQQKLLPPQQQLHSDSSMHQIVCRLGLRTRPHWGAYSAPPDPLAGFNEHYF